MTDGLTHANGLTYALFEVEHTLPEPPKCRTCGKIPAPWNVWVWGGYEPYCSLPCRKKILEEDVQSE